MCKTQEEQYSLASFTLLVTMMEPWVHNQEKKYKPSVSMGQTVGAHATTIIIIFCMSSTQKNCLCLV